MGIGFFGVSAIMGWRMAESSSNSSISMVDLASSLAEVGFLSVSGGNGAELTTVFLGIGLGIITLDADVRKD